MKDNITNVTIPSVDDLLEIKNNGHQTIVTDFALANGAMSIASKIEDDKNINYGATLLRNISATDPRYIETVSLQKKSDYSIIKSFTKANNTHIAVMPRFQNPEAMGIDLTEFNGESVLTIKGKIVSYPQRNAEREPNFWQLAEIYPYPLHTIENDNQAKLGQLWQQLIQEKMRNSEPEKLVGQYRVKNDYDSYSTKTYDCYQQQGKNYVYLTNASQEIKDTKFSNHKDCEYSESYRFESEPVRAMRCQDGSIQCLDSLVTCRLHDDLTEFVEGKFQRREELDTNKFEIGTYLNHEFMEDLVRSAEFTNLRATQKLSQINIGLSQDCLKRNSLNKQAEIER